MRKSEAVYFIRTMDDGGQPLQESCRHRVSGGPLPAEWWSITLYNQIGFLPLNDDGHLSVDVSDIAGTYRTFDVSRDRPAEDVTWLSSRAGGRFDLTLRLYRPDKEFLDNPASTSGFPEITRLDCVPGDAP